jgi:hypothetical protein
MVVCPKENFRKPCPICEHRAQLSREGDADDDLIKSLRPSSYPRSIYNVICYDSRREEDKGVQVWHTSNYLFEQHLLKLAEGPKRRGSSAPDSFVEFACPVEGKSISFSTEGKKMNTKHMALQFLDRDYEIDDETLESAHVLDELVEFPSYDEIYQMYWGEDADAGDDVEDEEEEERPRRSRRSSAPRSRRRPSKKEEPEDAEEEDEYEDEWEDGEEEEAEADDECPAGGVFGEDCNQYDECEDCEIWDDCYEATQNEDEPASRRRKPKKKPARKKPASRRKPSTPKSKKRNGRRLSRRR